MPKATDSSDPSVGTQAISFRGIDAVDHESPVPLYFQLSSYISKKIKSHQWQAGQLLPSEQDICEDVKVSRTVVRQAMAQLERDGLVTKRNGKRTSVAIPKYEGDLMQNLRGFYEDAIAKGKQPFTQVLSLKVIPAPPSVAAILALGPGEPVIELNRLRFLDDEPEVLVVTYLPEAKCPGLREENFANQSLYHLLASKYGIRIAKGSRTIEAIALEKGDAKLLRTSAGSPALLMKSAGLLADGTPIEYFIAKHRGDRAKFNVNLVSDSF